MCLRSVMMQDDRVLTMMEYKGPFLNFDLCIYLSKKFKKKRLPFETVSYNLR
jgi:hypothetical protein